MRNFSQRQFTPLFLIRHLNALARLRLSTVAMLLLSMALYPMLASAAAVLRCNIDQGGTTQVLDFLPVSDPYQVQAIDINGRFRFKAVVMGDARHIDYINLYTYSQASRQPVLLHQAKYPAPIASASASPAALTGFNYVYSPELERELKYGCALLEIAPEK